MALLLFDVPAAGIWGLKSRPSHAALMSTAASGSGAFLSARRAQPNSLRGYGRSAGATRSLDDVLAGMLHLTPIAGTLVAHHFAWQRKRSQRHLVALQAEQRHFFKFSLKNKLQTRRTKRPPARQLVGNVSSGNTHFDGDGRSYFHMGGDTPRIPFAMNHRHREKLLRVLQEKLSDHSACTVLLQGGNEISVYDTDTVWDFKQESNFQWLFGVREPGCFGTLDISTGAAYLFVPRLPEEYEAWMGPRRTLEWFRTMYEVDDAFFVDELADVLQDRLHADKLLVYHGLNRDSGLQLQEPIFNGVEQFQLIKDSMLWDALAECRVLKDDDELSVLQFVNDVSSDAHVAVMKGVRPGTPEYISEAEFKHYAFLRGCARVGYHCICPSGSRCAILHYGHAAFPNAAEVREGEMKLHDMGAEYHCYTSDITCTFPVDGHFTDAQRIVYEAVWEATLAVERAVQPGVSYRDMHLLAERVLLEQMTVAGLFQGSIEEMQELHIMSHFMPHGLGHCLGLDVHDVGGYPPGENRHQDKRVQQNLRCGRELMEGMVITVEPGFYFVDYLLKSALSDASKAQYIVPSRLAELQSVGGVRIEDDVFVTSDGCRVLTRVPRTVSEIEAVMAGESWEARKQLFREYHGEGTNIQS